MELHEIICHISILLLSTGAALSDIEKWRVSNRWLILWAAAGFAYEFIFFAGANIAGRLTGALIPAALLGVFFIFRMLGAGDIKLFCVLGIWMGAEDILKCMLFSFLIGAVISIISIVRNKNARERLFVLVSSIANMAESAVKEHKSYDYGAKKAGKARVNVCVFAFFGVVLKLMGVY